MKKIATQLIVLLGLSLLGSTFAAVNPGQAGVTSQGSFDIRLVLNPEVQVTGLQDLSVLGGRDPDAPGDPWGKPTKRSLDFCIYSSVGSYAITLTSKNGQNDFFHTDPGYYKLLYAGEPLTAQARFAYTIDFSQSGSAATVHQAISGQKYTGFKINNPDKTFCAGGNKNAHLDVNIIANDTGAVSPGVFSDVLSIMVTPE